MIRNLTRRTLLGTATASVFLPSLARAGSNVADRRLIVMVLRGALDGLHAVPPYGDGHYRRLRPRLAIGAPGTEEGALPLIDGIGLHPSLTTLHDLYREGQLAIMPAVATRYPTRSHFDAQNQLENGSGKPFGASDGWLNRALAHIDGGNARGLAFGHAVPLVLRGAGPVEAFAPSSLPPADADFLQRLSAVYADDPVLSGTLDDGMGDMMAEGFSRGDARRAARGQDLSLAARAVGAALADPAGPRIAVIESNGWDTHDGQIYRMRKQLSRLDDAVATLRSSLATAWANTAILMVTEFGRTAAENGSQGTDHGTGGVMFLAGGAVVGGKIVGTWPELIGTGLVEGRDVRPLFETEGVIKGVLHDHLQIGTQALDTDIFPDSAGIFPMLNLIR